jgi:hypothetical protein
MPETPPPRGSPAGAPRLRRLVIDVLLLVAVGLLAGGLWRAEVEWHGWGGLTWIGYFHLAVPVGAAAFIAWVAWANRHLPRWHRIFVVLVLALATAVTYGVTKESLSTVYTWSSWYYGAGDLIWRAQARVWWYLIPTLYAVLARALRLGVGFWRVVLAHWLFIGAQPLCIGLLFVAHRPSEANFLHAIKTGFIIPFLTVAIGILYLPGARPRARGR